ncbi:MAG: hypothetical protein LBJ92_03595, partial [Holosporales bacterium]|nr:hypothetical protein [Holosporales bacterium]
LVLHSYRTTQWFLQRYNYTDSEGNRSFSKYSGAELLEGKTDFAVSSRFTWRLILCTWYNKNMSLVDH